MRSAKTLTGFAVVAIALGLVMGPASAGKPFSVTPATTVYNCTDDDDAEGHSISFTAPTMTWPPNHKPVTVTITASNGSEDSTLTMLESTGSHSQYTTPYDPSSGETGGSGNTTDDVNPFVATTDDNGPNDDQAVDGEGTTKHTVLSERSGQDKGGRWYRFDVVAMWDDDHTCDKTFYGPWVPHDMRPSNRTPPAKPSTGTEL